MIKVTFKNPQKVCYDGLNSDAMFCLCESYITLQSGDLMLSSGKETNALVAYINIQSIEQVKPNEL